MIGASSAAKFNDVVGTMVGFDVQWGAVYACATFRKPPIGSIVAERPQRDITVLHYPRGEFFPAVRAMVPPMSDE